MYRVLLPLNIVIKTQKGSAGAVLLFLSLPTAHSTILFEPLAFNIHLDMASAKPHNKGTTRSLTHSPGLSLAPENSEPQTSALAPQLKAFFAHHALL